MKQANAADLGALIATVRRGVVTPARLFLVAGTSHLAEGWRDRVARLELAGDSVIEAVVRQASAGLQIDLTWESPADVIPLPAGSDQRARSVSAEMGGDGGRLEVLHFDPYSVVLRLVARGHEADYVDALEYMRRGWVEQGKLETMLAEILPRFTSETLAQDPAEFRRKFRGLRQLHASEVAHRHLA